jgi:ubiquitin-activating enzyme E1
MQVELNQSDKPSIDQNLYSRQIGAFGLETMHKLVKMKVLVLGVSGVGLELCKNLILAGPESVTIWDNRKSTSSDREWNYYMNPTSPNSNCFRTESVIGNL